MKRRSFMTSGLGSVALGATALTGCDGGRTPGRGAKVTEIAGLGLKQLRDELAGMLFDELLPFWDKYGIDHQKGGFMHTLAHDGRLVAR